MVGYTITVPLPLLPLDLLPPSPLIPLNPPLSGFNPNPPPKILLTPPAPKSLKLLFNPDLFATLEKVFELEPLPVS